MMTMVMAMMMMMITMSVTVMMITMTMTVMVMVLMVVVLNQTLLDLMGEFALMATLNIFALLKKHILVDQMEESGDKATDERPSEVVRTVVSQVAD